MDKFCPSCGNPLDEGAAFCDNCGAKVESAQPAQQPAQGVQYPQQPQYPMYGQNTPQYTPQPPKKRKKRKLWLIPVIIITVAHLAALGMIIYVMVQLSLHDDSRPPTESETEAQSTVSVTAPSTEAPTAPLTELPAKESTEASAEAPAAPSAEAPAAPSAEAPAAPPTEAPAAPPTEAPTAPPTEASAQAPVKLPYEDGLSAPKARDFAWIADAQSGSLEGKALSDDDLLGKWKGEIIYDGAWELVYITIGADASVTIEPYQINYGENWVDESGEAPYIFNGAFELSCVNGAGTYGSINLYTFLENHGTQYGVGTFSVNNTSSADVYMVRP